MNAQPKKTYSFSYDEENYQQEFDSIEDACKEAASCDPEEHACFWVGEVVPPPAPEDFFDVDDWIDRVQDQDEYCGDWADHWCDATKEQLEEANRAVRSALAAWLDRHGLRPTFFNVEHAKEFLIIGDGKYEAVQPKEKK